MSERGAIILLLLIAWAVAAYAQGPYDDRRHQEWVERQERQVRERERQEEEACARYEWLKPAVDSYGNSPLPEDLYKIWEGAKDECRTAWW